MQYIINISDFNEITRGIKELKSDLVCVSANALIGTDNSRTNLKDTLMNTFINVPPFTIITKELSSKFYANITDTEVVIDFDECKIYCLNNKLFADESNPMISLIDTNDILSRRSRLSNDILHSTVIHFDEITEDPGFEYIKSLKIDNGAKLYNPKGNENYAMYLYNNAVQFVKNDKVYLDIHDLGDTFIARFTISKKKQNEVSVYYRFVKLKKGNYYAY